jgi:dTDP-4-dehydrorhamnose 3,5-epimerase
MGNAPEPYIVDIRKFKKPTLLKGGLAVDDRGQVTFLNNLAKFEVKRFYIVSNHESGFVRAWHGHEREQKLAFVLQGAAMVKTMTMESYDRSKGIVFPSITKDNLIAEYIQTFVLSANKPAALFIPRGYYNGFMTLTDDAQIMFLSDKTLEQSKRDDVRIPAMIPDSKIWVVKRR